jgi:hypothetical protein
LRDMRPYVRGGISGLEDRTVTFTETRDRGHDSDRHNSHPDGHECEDRDGRGRDDGRQGPWW